MYQLIDSVRQTGISRIVQYGMALAAILLLAIINTNIYGLLNCFRQSMAAKSTVEPVQTNFHEKCSSVISDDIGVMVTAEVCHNTQLKYPAVAIGLQGSLLQSFTPLQAKAFVQWLKLCTPPDIHPACPIMSTPDSTMCKTFILSPNNKDDYICINNKTMEYHIVVNRVPFTSKTSEIVAQFLLKNVVV